MSALLSNLHLIFVRLRDEWELLEWKASDEYREMVKERLALHKQAMIDGTKSPYFDLPA